MSLNIAVLGAGLMGRLLAVELARAGHRVAVHERGGPDGQTAAAHIAAAMLAPWAESVVSEPVIVELGRASLERWPRIIAALSRPVFFQQAGTLVVWHPQDRDQAAQFSARLRTLDPALRGGGRVREVSGTELQTLEPALGQRFAQGIYLAGEGQLDNRSLLAALLAQLEASEVALHWHTETAPDQVRADWIVDCRGLGAKPEWRTLRGVRGEVVRVQSSEVGLTRPVRLLHPRYPLYIAPKPGGIYVIGATQIETEDTSPASVRSALELLSALYAVHPAFGEARILELAAHCRPALPDNLPEIRWGGGRLIQVNGLYRHGYLIAPAVMEATLALLRRVAERGGADLESWCAAQPFPSLYRR